MTFQGDGCPPVEPSRSARARRKALTIVLPTGVALGAGAAIAYAAIPSADGTIGACYSNSDGAVRFVDGPADCRKGADGSPAESFVSFNRAGPTGTAGVAGPAGPAGAPGGLGLPTPDPAAASDYLLEIEGIKGESKDSKHKDTIEIESFSWGASQTGAFASGGGGGAGKVSFQDMHFTTKVNKASPLLFKRAATGQHIKKAVLFVRKSGGGGDYMTIKLTDILVTGYRARPDENFDSIPTDQFSLNFAKIEYSYRPQNADGSLGSPVTSTYDLKAAKK